MKLIDEAIRRARPAFLDAVASDPDRVIRRIVAKSLRWQAVTFALGAALGVFIGRTW